MSNGEEMEFLAGEASFDVSRRPLAKGDVVPVKLGRSAVEPTDDQILWVLIRSRTRAIGFNRFRDFVDLVMCGDLKNVPNGAQHQEIRQRWIELRPFGVDAYGALKATAEHFLMNEVGIVPDSKLLESVSLTEESSRLGRKLGQEELEQLRREYFEDLRTNGNRGLPYIDLIIDRLPEIPIKDPSEVVGNCYGIHPARLTGPLALELIWSYWLEEGMLAQTLNAISLRFQNVRGDRLGADPLMRLELDPLRPLNNILWGYVQAEWDRLSVVRRASEYSHEYGLSLIGKAVPAFRTADNRSQFLGAFHNLLYLCTAFFQADDDTTVIADGFPILNALKEVHLILAHGAHNQFGDLPWTARVEMLISQWILARPEMREFLGGRVMVPYREPWMDRVDSVKSMMGWTDVSATFGEQLLLSIRYGSWTELDDAASAANWARYWRPEIQGYIHAYRAVTGVDLTERVDDTLPSVLLARRQASSRGGEASHGLASGQIRVRRAVAVRPSKRGW
jgi:hypothetical protein